MKRKLLFTFLMASSCSFAFAQFTTGNLVVLRLGDGAATLTGSTTNVSLLEFDAIGTAGTTVNLAATGTDKLTINGSANEGILKLSTDRNYLTLGGYDALTGVAATANTVAGNTPKVIARVGISGTVDYSTKIPANDMGGNFRNVISTDGTDLWFSTASSGVRYKVFGTTTTSTTISNPTGHTNIRSLGIYTLGTTSQLFSLVHNSATYTLATVGSGLPTTASQTPTNLPGLPVAATLMGDFVLLDLDAGVAGVDVLYYQDLTALTLKKYSLVSGTWVDNGSVALVVGGYGLTGIVKNNKATLFYTDGSNTTNNNLKRLDDANGYNAAISGTPVVIATSGSNYVFRGVAFTPTTTTLPVDLKSFSGKNTTNGVQLNWETASEKNNTRFEILRSIDKSNFQVISSVSGKGNSDAISKYGYLDAQPVAGVNYYKLNQVDFDGKTTPSNIVAVKTGLSENSFTTNVQEDNLKLTINALAAGKATIQLFDVSGRKRAENTFKLESGGNLQVINIGNLDKGVYVARLTIGTQTLVQKFVK